MYEMFCCIKWNLYFCFSAWILRENCLAGPALHDNQQRSTVIHLPLGAGVGWCDGAESTSSAGASYKQIRVGQEPTALAVGAGGGCLDIVSLLFLFCFLSPSLRETA